MKTLFTTLALCALTTPAFAISLKDRIEQVNREDQRAVAGTLNTSTGVMTITTQDMAEGTKGKGLSPRTFDVDLSALKGQNGTDGTNGTNGADGADGQDFDTAAHMSELAAATALGGLQINDPMSGQTTWGFGVGGQFDGSSAVAAGIRYGINDNMSAYGSVGVSIQGAGAAYSLGLSGSF